MSNEKNNKEAKRKLTQKAIKDINKKYKEKYEVEIGEYFVKINKYFQDSKIAELYTDLQRGMQECLKNDEDPIIFMHGYLPILLVEYFTDVNVPKDISKRLQLLEGLVDCGMLNPILEAMPQEEIDKVTKRVIEITKNINEYTKELAKSVDNIDFENEDILQMNKWSEKVKEHEKLKEEMKNKKH